MVDPIAKAAPGKALDAVNAQDKATPSKSGQSKFDRVRADLQDRNAQQIAIPPEVNQVSLQQQKAMQADLSRQVAKGAAPQKVLSVNMKRTQISVDRLTKRVNALPKTPSFQPLRDRLASIDAQFQDAGKLVNSIKGGESQKELLGIQMKMYQLGENLELMSKVVEQVTSGTKSILQTQV
ncbi:MAG TPA: hypothetical protein VHW45_14665 [Candidatus Sulfotelmatobacter sp.]|jgi:hypothetical protein|nr:hypothetical protein [Candidatus Sulfotelmatobacter sp.]